MGILKRINKWLLMTHFKNTFFENRVRWQLHSLLNYILYPEFRSSWNLKKVIYSNKYSILFISALLISLASSFFFGKSVSESQIDELTYESSKKDSAIFNLYLLTLDKNSKIHNLSTELKSRGFLEFKVIKESKIEHIANLRAVPDSIFFLMVKEADKYKIPYVIFFRIMEKESKFQFIPNSEGSGAMGYMQVVKSTFSMYYEKLNLQNGHTPGNNIRVAANLIHSIHSFWSGRFKDEKTVWEYTLAEYGCGRAPMMSDNGYFIPDAVKPGVNYVMKHYGR
jgi:hypothetical protein